MLLLGSENIALLGSVAPDVFDNPIDARQLSPGHYKPARTSDSIAKIDETAYEIFETAFSRLDALIWSRRM